ncbi:methyltransferase domain-containing protein [Paenibacillus sp. SI8]|uniref:methyltransferase domain-containing protein n=1 Tax=unclassified Paenibacillus TaxID=185978 RepID=UPI003465C874
MTKLCRCCGELLTVTFIDLGLSPLSNHFVKPEETGRPLSFYPLHTYVCGTCFLVQLEQVELPEKIFGEYAYFSSYSDSWLEHAKLYAEMMMTKLGFHDVSRMTETHPLVVEIACNDGYLLQYFRESDIDTLGIEPARNVAEAASGKGIPVITEFFGRELAQRLCMEDKQADLLIGNNVLAHVPDLHDFVGGLNILLKDNGTLTMEFPHLLQLIKYHQFDTIYHEHFSYLSLHTVQRLMAEHGLTIFDVEQLPTHGGSLRIYAKHTDDATKEMDQRVRWLLQLEEEAGLLQIVTYTSFTSRIAQIKRNIWDFLVSQKNKGQTIAAYGAPAKGNTLLNYCGIGKEMIDYVVDRNPYKQGLLLPGTLIPIYPPEHLSETKPDIVVIMPWNLKDEIAGQLAAIRGWGGKSAVWLPKIEMW